MRTTFSPSGALSPYYYKGGYFHGIHYGSFFDDSEALLSIMKEEETFLFNSPERRRILIDLFETNISEPLLLKLTEHIERLSPKIIKLAIACEPKKLRRLKRAIKRSTSLKEGQLYYCTDMEVCKTWLVNE